MPCIRVTRLVLCKAFGPSFSYRKPFLGLSFKLRHPGLHGGGQISISDEPFTNRTTSNATVPGGGGSACATCFTAGTVDPNPMLAPCTSKYPSPSSLVASGSSNPVRPSSPGAGPTPTAATCDDGSGGADAARPALPDRPWLLTTALLGPACSLDPVRQRPADESASRLRART